MPKHYAVGVNVRSGTVTFNNSKVMNINFPTSFKRRPSVALALGDVNNIPVYKQQVTKDGLQIKFKTNFSGQVEWIAMENDE